MKTKILVLVAIAFWVTGCGKKSDSPTIGSGVDAANTVLANLNLAGALIPKPATRQASNPASSNRSAFGTSWDSTAAFSMGHPKDDGTSGCAYKNLSVSFKDWMGYQFDKDAQRCNTSSINIFGRVKGSLAIFCAISYALGGASSSAAIATGSRTITFDATTKAGMKTACGIAPDVADGTTATLAVSHPSGNFDTQLVLSLGGDTITMFMTFSATVAKIATNENNSNGSQRVLVDLNTATQLLKAEYVSRNTAGGVYIHRLYSDAAADNARVMSQEAGSASDYRRYTVTGKPASTSELNAALSADANGSITTPAYTGNFNREACVNKNTGAISTDGPPVTGGAFTCGTVTSKTVAVSTGFGAVTTATGTVGWNALSSTTDFTWSTIDNMLTTAL